MSCLRGKRSRMNGRIICVSLMALASALAFVQGVGVSERAKAEQALRGARPGLNMAP
jgi:hypothetical protein